jgi:glucose-1-phosphatase
MPKNVPKALLFDLGKVLIPFDFTRAYAAMQSLTGLPVEEIRARLLGTTLYRQFETGRIEPVDFAAQVMNLIGFRCELPVFSEIWSSIFLPETLIPDEVIQRLQPEYRLIIVSNTNQLHFEMLRQTYPILRHFYGCILSYEVGVMKPDPAFYAAALSMAGCTPADCVFIDDLSENVEGARSAGFDGILFQSFPQLSEELKQRGVRLAQ